MNNTRERESERAKLVRGHDGRIGLLGVGGDLVPVGIECRRRHDALDALGSLARAADPLGDKVRVGLAVGIGGLELLAAQNYILAPRAVSEGARREGKVADGTFAANQMLGAYDAGWRGGHDVLGVLIEHSRVDAAGDLLTGDDG